jgi:hypothetical protein
VYRSGVGCDESLEGSKEKLVGSKADIYHEKELLHWAGW